MTPVSSSPTPDPAAPPATTAAQRAIDTLAVSRQQHATAARDTPLKSALAAAGHTLGGIIVVGMGTLAGLKLAFPWYAVVAIWIAAFYIFSPNLTKAFFAWGIGTLRDIIAAKKDAP